MTLINIEYGSIASSETMNKNFLYLDDKISDTSDSIMTSISSILSNIATINSRLSELAEDISTSRADAKSLVNSASMLPDWSGCITIALPYTAKLNGYVLLLPKAGSAGNLKVNNTTVRYKANNSTNEHSSQLVSIPIKKGDVVSATFETIVAYFLPSAEVNYLINEDDE